jgi:hypothetical protein
MAVAAKERLNRRGYMVAQSIVAISARTNFVKLGEIFDADSDVTHSRSVLMVGRVETLWLRATRPLLCVS